MSEVATAKSEAFARLLIGLLQAHVDSYTGSPGFMTASDPDVVDGGNTFVQMHVTMPDGAEYRVEVEAVV